MKKLIPFKENLCSKEAVKMISIKINDACNCKCSFCVDRGGKKTNEIDVTSIAKKAIELSDYKTVIITGGEPFLNFKEVLHLASLLRPFKDRIVLNTNGTLLSLDKVDKLNYIIDELQVSIHHFTEEKHNEIIDGNISFDNIKNSLSIRKFVFSVNSTFNNGYSEDEMPIAVDKLIDLCSWIGADRLRLTELKKVDDCDFISSDMFFKNDSPILSYDSKDLIQKGCTYYYLKNGINVSVKRLCEYAKGKNAPAFSCCFINVDGQNKIDVETKDTFKVIYPNGFVTDDWIFNKL